MTTTPFSPSTSVNLLSSGSNLTSNINLLQPTNFKVVIDRKSYGNLEFFAQGVNHPGISIPAPAVPYKRISTIAVPGDTLNFDELSMTVLVDEEMNSYTEVFQWLQQIVQNPDGRTDIPNQVDITVAITTSHNNLQKAIRYIDCVPTGMSSLEMSATNTAPTVITYDLSFRVGYFEII